MDLRQFQLNDTFHSLKGHSKEQIIVFNQWAVVGLDEYHQNSNTR